MRPIWLIPLTIVLSGCWFNNNDIRERLETGTTPPVIIPEGMDQPIFVDAMPIPHVDDPRGLADRDYRVELPEALSTTFGVEKIIIRKLGDDHWVFLDTPPPTVWPKVVEFWEANNLTIESADPGTGVLESAWIATGDGVGEEVFDSMKQDEWLRDRATQQHKFRLRIEPGVRTGSTEIYLEHRRMSLVGPVRIGRVDWRDESDDIDLEDAILTALAYNLGESIDDSQTVSLVAAGLQESRTELIPDSTRPVLKYRLDFNRAWATVGAALENARIDVEDLDRTKALYYVYYTSDHQPDPSFLSGLFKWGDKAAEQSKENRYLVFLEPSDDEVHVTVLKDGATLADGLIAERLLKVIKEYST
jgi:outer membrane protein assembly factor BamC